MPPSITNIFVLMLENRSFDHMLGFSGISGKDAETGQPTKINGLTGKESNSYRGQTYQVSQPADETMPVDPGHEFLDVLEELCGSTASYMAGGPYPPINNSGFVSDYAFSHTSDEGNAPGNYGEIMKCFSPKQLPVLNALAKSFAVCDNWHASIPGPTWPNRLFALGASSAGLDHSPSSDEMFLWEAADGLAFPNGSIFDLLNKSFPTNPWRIYSGDNFPIVAALKGITLFDFYRYEEFAAAVAKPSYPWRYTWIEPNYGNMVSGTFRGGNSQHPLDGVTPGEKLIKDTYEAIRKSPHWPSSLLIVTWDEHGGFFDHAVPPASVAPGDTQPKSKYNQYGFTFEKYGVRVPAVVVSPFIPSNIVDHRVYDHSSIPKTIEAVFGLPPLTARDREANSVVPLLSLSVPRIDAPTELPAPATPAAVYTAQQVPAPQSDIDSGNLAGFVHVAMRHDLTLSPPSQRAAILARVQSIQTRAQAAQYVAEVEARVQAAKAAPYDVWQAQATPQG